MILSEDKVDTQYMVGEEYTLSYFKEVYDKGSYERDEWAKSFLKQNKKRIRGTVYLIPYYNGHCRPNEMKIISMDYKKA